VLLRRLYADSHRVLVFTQMTRMLDILENFLNFHGYKYVRLDGSTTVEQRQVLMESFNNDKRIFCFILSTRSGGIGVNLTGADTVIFYDSDWNPTMDAQAQDRCHRIGQTRDVHIYRMISEKTVEENILKKANQKRMLSDMAIEGGCFTTALLKKHNIKELLDQPSGLVEADFARADRRKDEVCEVDAPAAVPSAGDEQMSESQFEETLAMVEDETDVLAAKELRAEKNAEYAEFDENVSWDESHNADAANKRLSNEFENSIKQIENELRPIERYAFKFLEKFGDIAANTVHENNINDIEKAKKEWEISRLKVIKDEEDRRATQELDEDAHAIYTYDKTENFAIDDCSLLR